MLIKKVEGYIGKNKTLEKQVLELSETNKKLEEELRDNTNKH